MLILTTAQAATQVYDSTATVKGENGVFYLISCRHDEIVETITARAARFYGQEMTEVISSTQIWTTE